MKRCGLSAGTDVGEPDAIPATSNKAGTAWRIVRRWAGMSGAFMMFANCPCCGQAGCPVGLLGAGVFGAVMAGALRFLNGRSKTC